jgi:hypothetical protein
LGLPFGFVTRTAIPQLFQQDLLITLTASLNLKKRIKKALIVQYSPAYSSEVRTIRVSFSARLGPIFTPTPTVLLSLSLLTNFAYVMTAFNIQSEIYVKNIVAL